MQRNDNRNVRADGGGCFPKLLLELKSAHASIPRSSVISDSEHAGAQWQTKGEFQTTQTLNVQTLRGLNDGFSRRGRHRTPHPGVGGKGSTFGRCRPKGCRTPTETLHFDVALAIQDSGPTAPSRAIDKDGGPIQAPEMRLKSTNGIQQ